MRKFLLTIPILCTLSCAGTSHRTTEDECQRITNSSRQLNCYELGIRSSINNQFNSDLQDYEQLTTTYNAIQDVKVAITLTNMGAIKDIQLLTTSGDAMLDNFFIQIIKNASPFSLPSEAAQRKKLQHFIYRLTLP